MISTDPTRYYRNVMQTQPHHLRNVHTALDGYAYVLDASIYCQDCIGSDEETAEVHTGESDRPVSCEGCGGLLDVPLTSDGETYVKDRVNRKDGDPEVLKLWRETFDYLTFIPEDYDHLTRFRIDQDPNKELLPCDPGCYPMVYVCTNGDTLCSECADEELRAVREDYGFTDTDTPTNAFSSAMSDGCDGRFTCTSCDKDLSGYDSEDSE